MRLLINLPITSIALFAVTLIVAIDNFFRNPSVVLPANINNRDVPGATDIGPNVSDGNQIVTGAKLNSTSQSIPQQTSSFNDIRDIEWVGIAPDGDNGWAKQPSLLGFMRSYWKHNRFCETFHHNLTGTGNSAPQQQRLNITLGCKELHERGQIGTGNFITGIYGIRLAAQVLKVDLHITCPDAAEMSNLLVLPWLLGHFPPVLDETTKHHQNGKDIRPTIQQVCSTYNKVPISYLLDQMQFDLRRMALSLVGIPSSANNPAAKWASENLGEKESKKDTSTYSHQLPTRNSHNPLLNETYLDDVAVHFRCGDIMIGSASGAYYGFQKFYEIVRYLSPAARSIGIVTQPFQGDDGGDGPTFKTPLDRSVGNRCKTVVTALVDYLQDYFPQARIRIHNGIEESLALTYARMIMANQTVAASMSSFSVFPIVSTFGTGYLPKPRRWGSPYAWIDHSPRLKDISDNVVLVKANESSMISGMDMRAMWDAKGEAIALEWFRNTSLILNCTEASCRMEAI